jgi:hypothetical protein
LIALALLQTNIAPSPIPLAPQHPVEEDEDSNNDAALGAEDEEETESDIVMPRSTAEQRSKGNQDRDAAREGATRGSKRPLSPSRGESSSKAAALSPSSGRTAPMKQRKTLSTLGGRKVSTSADASKGAKKSSESGPAQASPAAVAPPRRTLKTARK